MGVRHKDEQGFSLIEVLAAITILSIFTLVLTSYFTQALSSTKHNQSKTVMIHLARNTLFYIEKQPFARLNEYFREDGNLSISSEQCQRNSESEVVDCNVYAGLVYDPMVLESVLNPVINGVHYSVTITYQADDLEPELTSEARRYLLPVSVTVQGPGDKGKRNSAVVEGYITDEKIR